MNVTTEQPTEFVHLHDDGHSTKRLYLIDGFCHDDRDEERDDYGWRAKLRHCDASENEFSFKNRDGEEFYVDVTELCGNGNYESSCVDEDSKAIEEAIKLSYTSRDGESVLLYCEDGGFTKMKLFGHRSRKGFSFGMSDYVERVYDSLTA